MNQPANLLERPDTTDDISDIPIAVHAAMLTRFDSLTGWVPERDRSGEYTRDELQAFCGSIIARMSVHEHVDSDDLDILLAIGAGISNELDTIYREIGK